MIWTVKRIQEDDYGCEERTEDAKATVLVTLVNENGQERLIRVEDDWLYANGIDEGDRWPSGISAQEASPVILTAVLPISKTRSTPATRAMPSTGSPTD